MRGVLFSRGFLSGCHKGIRGEARAASRKNRAETDETSSIKIGAASPILGIVGSLALTIKALFFPHSMSEVSISCFNSSIFMEKLFQPASCCGKGLVSKDAVSFL